MNKTNKFPPRSESDRYGWYRSIEANIRRYGLTSSERERLKQLEREYKELRRVNDFLKTASALFAQAGLGRQLTS